MTKTKYLQILTTVMRWTAFIIMITLAGLRLSRGIIFRPPVSDFSGVPNLFGVCVYSFMCHHSLPSLGNLLDFFGIFGGNFWEFSWIFFGGIFWRIVCGGFFVEDLFGRIFLGGFFWEDYFGWITLI